MSAGGRAEEGESEIERAARLLAALPGLGPRSARRAVLHLITRRAQMLEPLRRSLESLRETIVLCPVCGVVDVRAPCAICADPKRDSGVICVVEETGDVWALERAGAHGGGYHVLGGALRALDGVGPEDLNIARLLERAREDGVREIVLATNATVEGQTTAHYLAGRLAGVDVKVSRLARGIPVGGELDYLDDGTLADAMRQRKPL